MNVFNWNVTEHRATNFAVFKYIRTTVQFMHSAADSATGCCTKDRNEDEAYNGTGSSSPWPYIYK